MEPEFKGPSAFDSDGEGWYFSAEILSTYASKHPGASQVKAHLAVLCAPEGRLP